jgi:hypothetical protein
VRLEVDAIHTAARGERQWRIGERIKGADALDHMGKRAVERVRPVKGKTISEI